MDQALSMKTVYSMLRVIMIINQMALVMKQILLLVILTFGMVIPNKNAGMGRQLVS